MLNSEMQSYEAESRQLVELCRNQDQQACNTLLQRYNRRIFNTAYRILGEESWAEDALQETLINVYRGLGNFRGESKISTWISRITVNVCLGMLRKGKKGQVVALEEELAYTLAAEKSFYSDPLEHTAVEEMRALIEETFASMTDKQGEVVRLHDMEGFTIQEIAQKIGCPAGTVKSRLFYGRQEFKEIYSALVDRRTCHPTIQ